MFFFFFQAEDGIRDRDVTGVQTCALPILPRRTVRELCLWLGDRQRFLGAQRSARSAGPLRGADAGPGGRRRGGPAARQIGRASCRERVEVSGGGGGVE